MRLLLLGSLLIWQCGALAQSPEIRSSMPRADRNAEEASVVKDVYVDGRKRNQRGVFVSERQDADGDGVADIDDMCPNSQEPVNLCGCSSQSDPCCLDSDGDGVRDCDDKCPNTPPLVKINAEGCVDATALPSQQYVDLKFAFDSAELPPGHASALLPVIRLLAADPELHVQFDGHADARGPRTYNQVLSRRRAEAVADFILRSEQVNPAQIHVRGHGEDLPLIRAQNESAFAANRRVNANYYYPSQLR